jgi:hypothetical protein
MTKIVDFNLFKAKAETNPKLYNRETNEFCYAVEYYHDGKRYCMDLWAKTWTDAELKLKSVQDTAVVVGKLVEKED